MNIFRQELKMSFRSWLYFTLSLLFVIVVFGSFFNVFQKDAKILDELLSNFPDQFKAAFGFSDVNLSEVEGFFSFIISYVVLIGAIFGMKMGVSLLSEEGRKKTSDFLISKPIKRELIVTSKLTATLTYLIAQNVVVFGVGYTMIAAIVNDTLDIGVFALLTFSMFFTQLFFVGVGFFIAALSNKLKGVMSVTLGVVFFFFIIELINESINDRTLSYITPFAHYKGSYLLEHHSYDPVFLVIDLAVFALFTALAYRIFLRKDIHAV